ncbi:MAG: ATP-grasp domain-containing protein, partial [Chitinophagales bacterium]|nr:ATP-grasp domain-containing protein [Chitinophagales bacterium]
MYYRKIVLLGSGELGKELVIALKRLGCEVVAVDSYAGAPAMQVADRSAVLDMLDGPALKTLIRSESPDFVVPEIEAIRTEALEELEQEGFRIVPSARAVRHTMNRRAIRDLAARELGLPTARYAYAASADELARAAAGLGFPCVVKPLMSSSGKGQS